MTPEERAQALRAQAGQLLSLIRLRDHCSSIGEIMPTGSYFLDLMMYPDIDLILPPASAEAMMELGAKLAAHDEVRMIQFAKGGPDELADSLYLKPVIEYGNWQRPWKIDMWSMPATTAERKIEETEHLRAAMTPHHRRCILHYKCSVLTEAGRTPKFSGIFIYRAVINEGLESFEAITNYLRQNKIDV